VPIASALKALLAAHRLRRQREGEHVHGARDISITLDRYGHLCG